MQTTNVVIRRLFEEVLGDGRLEVLDELLALDYRDRTPPPGIPSDRTGVRAKFLALQAAFSDLHFSLDELITESNIAAARWHWVGIQNGPWGNIPPTGKKVGVRGMDFYRVQEGRIVEHWDVVDQLGLIQSLGASPSP